MRRWMVVLLTIGWVIAAWSYIPLVARADEPVVRAVLLWSETCPHCHVVLNETLPPLQEQYGHQLEVLTINAADPSQYELIVALTQAFQVPPDRRVVPMLFIGDTMLVGSQEIPERLPGLIEQHLAAGGVDYPAVPGLVVGPTPASTPPASSTPRPATSTPTPIPAAAEESFPIHLAYFYQPGCQECDGVQLDLNYLQHGYPQLVVHAFDVKTDATLAEWLGQRAGVSEEKRLTAPAVFVGDEALVGADLHTRSLEALIARHAASGAEPVWEEGEASRSESAASIVERFRSFGLLTVLAAGLVDGLNPCAFATLVFFVSYLTISGRKGREILSVGGAFTLGVFVAYLLVGFGFYHMLGLLGDWLARLGRWVYGLTAVFCLALAVFSFLDFLKARRGQIGDMALNLPHKLRMRINATIRKTRKSRALVPVAFATGVIVSFLELACTGQVYLPTIIFVMSLPELKTQATLFLLLYNLLFIAPLVVVFVLAYCGTGAKQFSDFLEQRAAAVKLGMSFLFLALGGWLAFSLL